METRNLSVKSRSQIEDSSRDDPEGSGGDVSSKHRDRFYYLVLKEGRAHTTLVEFKTGSQFSDKK